MKQTAREIISKWAKAGSSLPEIERALELPQGSLAPLYETEGPAPPELEILLNMMDKVPSLLRVAQENFDLKRLVRQLFEEWKESQSEILETMERLR